MKRETERTNGLIFRQGAVGLDGVGGRRAKAEPLY